MNEPAGRRVRLVAEGFFFLEGPRWREDRLYVSDFYGRRVYEFDETGRHRAVCDVPRQPSGLGFTPDGALMVVSMLDQRLLRLEGGQLTEVADMSPYMDGPANDMVVDPRGWAYVGNFGQSLGGEDFAPTSLVRVSLDGGVAVAARDVCFPNGAVITPDGAHLLVAETFASRITRFDIADDGVLSSPTEFARFEPHGGRAVLPDGMALDAEGAVWMGDAGGSGPLRVREGGTVVDRVDTGNLAVYAVALGGPRRRTLFMCAAPPLGASDPVATRAAVLLACEVDVPAAGLP